MATRIGKVLRRFLVPRVVVSLYYLARFGARISPRAEVEISPNLRFGRGAVVSSFTKIKATEGTITIGERCGFAAGCFVSAGEKGVVIGDGFICGPNVVIVSSNYNHHETGVHLEDQGRTSKGVRIGDNVWIGANSTVLDGSVIGDNTIVVAHSLVNRRYPPNSILQGNPAKVILRRSPSTEE